MPTQLPLTPLTAVQVAERLGRVVDIDLHLEQLDLELAVFKRSDKDAREPLLSERSALLRQIRETRDLIADADMAKVTRPARFDRAAE